MKKKHPHSFSKAVVYLKAVLLCTVFLVMMGCGEGSDSKSSESAILEFKVTGVIKDGGAHQNDTERAFESLGVINGRDITVVVPWETNRTALRTGITVSELASVNPGSGQSLDFTTSKSFTVTAEDGTQSTYTVTVIQSRIQSIEVTKLPTKVTYTEGEEFERTGMEVTGTYSGDDPFTVKIPHTIKLNDVSTLYTISTYDKNRIGTQELVVSIDDKTAIFSVTVVPQPVIPPPVITTLAITTPPAKLIYTKGDPLDLTGMVVKATYSNGEPTDVKEYAVSGYNPDKLGTQTLEITLGGISAFLDVTVNNSPSSLTLEMSIGIDQNHTVTIFGKPAGEIVLSAYGTTTTDTANPKEIVLSTSTTDYDRWSIKWWIDGELKFENRNIITIKGVDYTLEIPHTITFVGTAIKDGRTYSESISFKVKP